MQFWFWRILHLSHSLIFHVQTQSQALHHHHHHHHPIVCRSCTCQGRRPHLHISRCAKILNFFISFNYIIHKLIRPDPLLVARLAACSSPVTRWMRWTHTRSNNSHETSSGSTHQINTLHKSYVPQKLSLFNRCERNNEKSLVQNYRKNQIKKVVWYKIMNTLLIHCFINLVPTKIIYCIYFINNGRFSNLITKMIKLI